MEHWLKTTGKLAKYDLSTLKRRQTVEKQRLKATKKLEQTDERENVNMFTHDSRKIQDN